jgi:hypothetical protein
VKLEKAKQIVREVGTAVARWRETATATGFTNQEIERMRAFVNTKVPQKAVELHGRSDLLASRHVPQRPRAARDRAA